MKGVFFYVREVCVCLIGVGTALMDTVQKDALIA